jgi:hypothetical protein
VKYSKGSVMTIKNINVLRRIVRLRSLAGLSVTIVLFFWGWSEFGYPYSYTEAVFLFKLQDAVKKGATEVKLKELTPSDWEIVCESHGYDEPLYLPQYQKKFPTAGRMQDGAWGLIFIKKDGSFTSISSSCAKGVYVEFLKNRCLARTDSILFRESKNNSQCKVVFAAK